MHPYLHRIEAILLMLAFVFGPLLLCPFSATSEEKPPSGTPRLIFIDCKKEPEGVLVTIQTDRAVPSFKSFTLSDQGKIVFDLFGVKSPYRLEQSIPVHAERVKQIRHYGHPEKLRVVIDGTGIEPQPFSAERRGNSLIIAVGGLRLQAPDAAGPPPRPAAPEPRAVEPAPEVQKPASAPSSERSGKAPGLPKEELLITEIPDPTIVIEDAIDTPDTRLPPEKFDLETTIRTAMAVNLGLKISEEETKAAQAVKNEQRTYFYPTVGAEYQYTRYDEGVNFGGVTTGSENVYEFSTTLKQPIFAGFSLINQFRIASLGLDISKIREEVVRQDILFDAQVAYFRLLKAQKLAGIARKTVDQITAQRDIARSYYRAGMTGFNEYLQAQVELANAQQEWVVARNNLHTAMSEFNTLLRKPISAQVELEEVETYTPFEHKLAYCLETAEKNRHEITVAELTVQRAEKELALGKKDYFPSLNLEGTYFKNGSEWNVNGGDRIFDPEGWSVAATASWDFWQWGRTRYRVQEKLSRLNQARHQKQVLLDQIRQQVKTAYLKNLENRINIKTIQTAIGQAEENFRINQERFKGQAATSTDVLIAQTLLARTMTNYYTALYDFKISKAALFRTLGRNPAEWADVSSPTKIPPPPTEPSGN